MENQRATKIAELFSQYLDKPMPESPSPAGNFLKPVLRGFAADSLTMEFEVRREMTNPGGTLHGGMACLMADEIIGMTVFYIGKANFFASVNLHIDFLRPVPFGSKVLAQSRIIREGSRLVNAECELRNEKGEIVCRAVSNLIDTGFPVPAL